MNLTLDSAENLIIKNSDSEDVLYEITEIVGKWPFTSTNKFSEIKSDILDLINKLKKLVNEGVSDDVNSALHCIVHNTLYENLISEIKLIYKEKDYFIYQKSKSLISKKVSLPQLGSKIDYAYNFPAAFTELSMLDKYTSPMEKLNCLVTTFDILYAELKTILVSMISKYSDKENDIPIINNNEIYPALLIVMIKSQLTYLFSNLFYIKFFCPDLTNEPTRKQILEHFENAADMLYNLNEKQIHENSDHSEQLQTSLNQWEFNNLYDEVSNYNDEPNFLNEARRKYCQQIHSSLSKKLMS